MATEEQGKKIIETGEKAGEMGFMRLDTDEPVNDTLFTEKIMAEFWKRDQDEPPPVDGTILDQETYKKIDNVPEGLPKLKGLRVTHGIVDEITNTEERWQDKFPYGPK